MPAVGFLTAGIAFLDFYGGWRDRLNVAARETGFLQETGFLDLLRLYPY